MVSDAEITLFCIYNSVFIRESGVLYCIVLYALRIQQFAKIYDNSYKYHRIAVINLIRNNWGENRYALFYSNIY